MTKDEAIAVKKLFDIIDELLFICFKGVNTALENFAAEIDELNDD